MKSTMQFRKLIPLFKVLPADVFDKLDLSGFFLPTGEIAELREELEGKLNHFVVSYRADIFNLNSKASEHLCAIVKGADLDKKKLHILKQYEKKAKRFGVTFVIYKKPLEIMEIKDSALYKEYLKKGLL